MSETVETLNDALADGTNEPSAGVPTPAGTTGTATPVTPQSAQPSAEPSTDTSSDTGSTESGSGEVMDYLPSITRTDKDVELKVDDNLNFIYVLKNGKQLKTSVVKPDLGISTQLSDSTVKINESVTGERYLTVNNLSVYKLAMEKLIRVILVDGAPLHTVSFDSLSKIGMTKSELDDFMGIITTFYLSE